MAKAHVLFADSFEKAYQGLDATIQRRVIDFMLKLRKDPDGNGLNLKQPQGALSKEIWTARVNDNFRAVLFRPTADTFYLVTIRPHDDAYAYAARIVWDINKVTGGVDFWDHGVIREILVRSGDTDPGITTKGYFDAISDADFGRLGVNASLVPVLREIRSEDALLGITENIPKLAAQVVLALADGHTVDQVWEDIVAGSEAEDEIDPEDYSAAAERPATRETFAVVTDDTEELERMLLKPMSEWRVYLHPEQRKIAYRAKPYNGPVKVTGGPGTGKTVVALHRVKALADRLPAGTGKKILLTTYTNALSDLLGRLLDDLGGPELTGKVEVLNIDKVVRDVLRQDSESQWAGVEVLGDAAIAVRWDDVVASSGQTTFDRLFLIGEWEQVILAQNIRTRDEYFAARRSGRGRRLIRAERLQVWKLVQEFERRLDRDKAIGFKQAAVKASDVAATWSDADRPYRHVVIDEAQDLHAAHWTLLRALVPAGPDDMFLVGDTFQRIYDNRVTLGKLGIDVRGGRSKRLTLNYRTTRQILADALRLSGDELPDDLDEGSATLKGYRSVLRGGKPHIKGYSSMASELAALSERVRSWHDRGISLEEIAVFARTSAMASAAAEALNASGITATLVKSGQKPASAAGVQTMTMHRAKGLEFRAVAIVGADAAHVPLDIAVTAEMVDHLDYRRDLQRERSLLFVAATRAREALSITWSGQPSPFLEGLLA
ncbi:UvrD-helicase domain-containing protein [Nonomuraea sp. KM88]|uniref:UvrD-helicase domain-containing protein n=1 Tax=Nonomuraea sp. KM88 TaxID=3457427 RepID=UPI003FCDEC01